jgi:hypothetical protein
MSPPFACAASNTPRDKATLDDLSVLVRRLQALYKRAASAIAKMRKLPAPRSMCCAQ